MAALRYVISRSVALRQSNIDTDQIIPARFLSTTERSGLGRYAFNDWRADHPEFAFNKPENKNRRILVAGRNFGCGSSREHAPWALTDLGLAAVVSSEIADIFRGNALKNGLLPVVLPQPVVEELLDHPEWELTIDVAARTLRVPDGREFEFPLDPFAQTCLLEGVDELGFLLARHADIEKYEESRHVR